ncbi:MAG TPA: DNA repair helicase XPB [Thermomicrobiaceae bacterium]|nr:DNA repair helicase XPB [Thermomicrobiaceae bacterium]
MSYQPANPIIVQSDKSILLEVNNPGYEEARDALARFAELEKSPEHIHTYRITPLSLWNAAAAGYGADFIIGALEQFGKYELPGNVRTDISDYVSRYGRVKLVSEDGHLRLVSDDQPLLVEIANHRHLAPFIVGRDARGLLVDAARRGHLKQSLVQFGYPAEDLAGYVEGAPFEIALRSATLSAGEPFTLRDYQRDSVAVFHAGGAAQGGSGVIVMPCGAGKTMVGLAAMAELACHTLILTPSIVAARQWMHEIVERTTIPAEAVGEYSGEIKQIRPITVTTYQVLTYRPKRTADFPHFALFNQGDWGLIIYDEVHLLPAPVFRITAEIQARRRLGLTATLVREDHCEGDVFALIGPKKYDVPWKDLERQGWIATAECHEVRIKLPEALRLEYALTEEREKYRFAAENPAKLAVLDQLVAKHRDDHVLIIGQYLDQLDSVAARFDAPLITGKTATREREKLYEAFRQGEFRLMVVSKVANFSIDLPDASVAIQLSGTFGSRQEEAQRLGRILRPKSDGTLAHFYSLVTRETRDQEFAANRQKFLTEQGYSYEILYEDEVADFQPRAMPEPRLLSAVDGVDGVDEVKSWGWSSREQAGANE